MPTFTCTGRDAITRTFEYRFSTDLQGLRTFRVTARPVPEDGAFFELAVSELDATTVRVVMAHHFNRPEYAGMGIPEALLPIVKQQLGMVVESSPAQGTGDNVYRQPNATKYWERLRAVGGATYDAARDVYSVI